VRLAPLLVTAALLVACGEERKPPPRVFEVEPPKGVRAVEFARAGITLERPRNWQLRRREAPAVFELASGDALVACWAYRREEPLPEPGAQLDAARERLLEAISERDPEFRLLDSSTTAVGGSPAIDVLGEQVVARMRVRTRSVHVFEAETEYVIEALARPPDFALVERRVLEPLLASLELAGRASAGDDAAGGEGDG
jgi:hypothetical protein